MDRIEVVCVGLGPIGCRLARRIVTRPDLRLVGAIDTDPAKLGRDLGEVAELGTQTGVRVVAAIDEVAAHSSGAVAVHATASRMSSVFPQLTALVGAGCNVLSTCEELCYPWTESELAQRLDTAARAAGVTVLGGGINPGFMLDTLPLVLSVTCVRVDHVKVRRLLDTNQRRLPLQRKAGIGLTVQEFRERAATGDLGHVGLEQSAALLAHGLGWQLTSFDKTLDPVVADRATETGLGVVSAGRVIGQRQLAIGRTDEREVIRFELEMSAGAESVNALDIEGEPDLHQVICGGVNGDVGTEAIMTNLIPFVALARPGLLTMLDVLPLAYRGRSSE